MATSPHFIGGEAEAWRGGIMGPSYIKQGAGRIRVKIHAVGPNHSLYYVGKAVYTIFQSVRNRYEMATPCF